MKCRDKLGLPMAGPKLPLMGYCAYYLRQADYKRRRALKPCHIGVSSHPLMWLFYLLVSGKCVYSAILSDFMH